MTYRNGVAVSKDNPQRQTRFGATKGTEMNCDQCFGIGIKAHPDYMPLVMRGIMGEDVSAEMEDLMVRMGKKGSRSQNWMMIPCDHQPVTVAP